MLDFLTTLSNFIWSEFCLIPLLFLGGLYLTIGLKGFSFLNFFKGFRFLFKNNPKDLDEGITPFQTLMTAQSATIGTGNIIGVALAIQLGGPGAIFWMWIVALVGMSTKYAEAVLAVYYREKGTAFNFVGGPMYYIKNGLGPRWQWLALSYALFGAIAAFGIGNTVQSNAVSTVLLEYFSLPPIFTGIILASLVGLVLIGGITRISKVASTLVPLMALLYLAICSLIIFNNFEKIPTVLSQIFISAFEINSASGAGIWLAIKWGFARGIFSNEAGLGSAAIAHAASKTKNPVEQGIIAMLGTFIDTICICTLTALVILLTIPPESLVGQTSLAATAFSTGLGNLGGMLIGIALSVFAFTTILGWSYYGERCLNFLTGNRFTTLYRILWISAILIGSVIKFEVVWLIADVFNGLMAIPNIIALFLLSPLVFRLSAQYTENYKLTKEKIGKGAKT